MVLLKGKLVSIYKIKNPKSNKTILNWIFVNCQIIRK